MPDFYPQLYEAASSKIRKGSENAEILRTVISMFPEKYGESSAKSVKNLQRLPTEELAKDIVKAAKKLGLSVDSKPRVELAPKDRDPETGGLSGKFETIFISINGNPERFVLRGEQKDKATSTSTTVKECMVCYFYSSQKEYYPLEKKKKNKLEDYQFVVDEVIQDITNNGIPGVKRKDAEEVITFLSSETMWNVKIANAFNNAISIGNWLRQCNFFGWNIKRDEFFDKIKEVIGYGLFGFPKKEVDKWNPMDIMLIKPGSESEIKRRIDEAFNEDNEDLQLGKINSLFVDELDSKNPHSLILAISLKESKSQSGKATSYLDKNSSLHPSKNQVKKELEKNIEPLRDKYKITAEEKTWEPEVIEQNIIHKRESIATIISKRLDEFNYMLEDNDIAGFNSDKKILAKYASLKILNYLLLLADAGENIFTELIRYGLSISKNPTFFKLKGNDDGDAQSVYDSIEVFPALAGVQLYNKVSDTFDGKIAIKDGNNNAGIEINYAVEFTGDIYLAKIQIRSNSSDPQSQVVIEINKWEKDKDLNESFYPRLFT